MTTSTASLSSRLVELLTRDYQPRWARRFAGVPRPLAAMAGAAVAAALCGYFLHPNAYAFAVGLGLLLAVGLAWPSISLAGVRGSLAFDRRRTTEGEVVRLTVTVSNRLPWSAWGLSIRGLDDALDQIGDRPGLDRIPAFRTHQVVREWTAARRGEAPRGQPSLATAFPFGLREATRPLTIDRRLIVWPRVYPVGAIPEMPVGEAMEGPAIRDRPGTGGDLLGVRPYRRGDSFRRIHWAQTAKHDQPIVCELQSRAVPRVRIVLDVNPLSYPRADGEPSVRRSSATFEWAARLAASFVVEWLGDGVDLRLVLGDLVVTPGGGEVARRRACLDAIARIELTPGASLERVLASASLRADRDAVRIVIGTDVGFAALGAGARRLRDAGLRVVVLTASGFDGPPSPPVALPVRPWMRIDHPGQFPLLAQLSRKGVCRAR